MTAMGLERKQRKGGRVWLWSAAAAVVSAVVLVPASPAAALPSNFTPYHIINGDTPSNAKMCLAVRDDPPQIGTPIVQKPCSNTGDRLEGFYDGASVPDLQRTTTGMWITQGTWCIGGDVSARGHAVVIKGTYLNSTNCLSFNVLGNAAIGFDLQETSSGLCLGISGGALTSGAPLIFWTCEGTRSWKYPNPPDIHGGMAAGFKICDNPSSCGNSWCTLGFNVYDQNNKPYFLTAGHCAAETTDPGSWYPRDLTSIIRVTTGATTVFRDASTGDWALVAYTNNGYTNYGTVNYYNTWKDITGSNNAFGGEHVYFYGAASGMHEGTVHSTNATDPDGLTGMISTTICLTHGDSGGPLYANDTVTGLPIAVGIAISQDFDPNGNCTSGGYSYFMSFNTIKAQILSQTGLNIRVY